MKTRPNPDHLSAELAAIRTMIAAHPNMQRLLDLAADDADRRALSQETSRRVAWRVAAAFGGLAVLALAVAGGAVATSMQTLPPPDVLVVDKAGGVVQPLISLAEYQIAPEEATIRRNVDTFVQAYEGYSYEQADTHYYTSAAFMSPQLQTMWVQKWDNANKDSPPNKYKQDRRVRVAVGAITMLRNGPGAIIGARASFTKTVLLNNAEEGPPTQWIANISFRWVNQPTNERDRRINDLGMEITDYTSDRDLGAAKPPILPPAPRQTASPVRNSPMALVSPAATQQVTP